MIEIEGIDPEKILFIPNGIPRAAAPERRRRAGGARHPGRVRP